MVHSLYFQVDENKFCRISITTKTSERFVERAAPFPIHTSTHTNKTNLKTPGWFDSKGFLPEVISCCVCVERKVMGVGNPKYPEKNLSTTAL